MKLCLLSTTSLPIFKQLQIEEAFLRADTRNLALLNLGTPPAIVMGLSAHPEKVVHLDRVKDTPLIKRFSGGGTVYVDENTLFVTFIFGENTLNIPLFPKNIMEWSENFYHPIFNHKDFALRENDYVFGSHKFGGNAQYIQKGRFLHHTSFLWDYDAEKMQMLQLPEKRPQYRGDRPHSDFLCTLKQKYACKKKLFNTIEEHLSKQFLVEHLSLSDVQEVLTRQHRKSTGFYVV